MCVSVCVYGHEKIKLVHIYTWEWSAFTGHNVFHATVLYAVATAGNQKNKKHLFIYYYYYFFPLLSVLSAWRLYYSLNFFFFFRGIQMRARGTATCRFFQFLVSPHHHFPTARLYTPFAQQPGAIINRVMQSSSSRSKTLFFFRLTSNESVPYNLFLINWNSRAAWTAHHFSRFSFITHTHTQRQVYNISLPI